jgi:hypothetical protein
MTGWAYADILEEIAVVVPHRTALVQAPVNHAPNG